MKRLKLLCLFLFLIANPVSSQEYQEIVPDVLIKTKLDHGFTSLFIEKARNFLVSNEIKDPLDFEILDRIKIIEYPGDYIPGKEEFDEKSQVAQFYDAFMDFIRLKNLDNARVILDIYGLSQKVEGISVKISPDYDPDLKDIVTSIEIKLNEITIGAKEVLAEIQIPKNGRFERFIQLAMNGPSLKTPEAANISLSFKILVHQDQVIHFELLEAGFTEVGEFLSKWGDKILIEPNLTVDPHPYPLFRVGNSYGAIITNDEFHSFSPLERQEFLLKEWGIPSQYSENFNLKSFSLGYFIGKYGVNLQGVLLDLVIDQIKSGSLDSILDKIESIEVGKDNWFTSKNVNNLIHFNQVTSTPEMAQDVIDLYVTSSFCESHILESVIRSHSVEYNDVTRKDPRYLFECLSQTVPYDHPVKLTYDDFALSNKLMAGAIQDKDADIILSVGQDYISKILDLTAQRGMWDEMLTENELSFWEDSKNQVFVVFEEKGKHFDLYLDLDFTGISKFQGLLIGRKSLHFPVKLSVEIGIAPSPGPAGQKKKGDPMLVLKIVDVETSNKFLKNGDPSLRLSSEVNEIKPKFFQKPVLKALREKINSLVGFTMETELPALTGLNIDEFKTSQFEFFSDGAGRATITVEL